MINPAKKKRKNILTIVIAGMILGTMITFTALRPPEEETQADDFTSTIMSAQKGSDIPSEKRDELRRQWERFSPDTRSMIRRELLRNQIQKARRETEGMSRKERREKIRELAEKIRERGKKRDENTEQEIKEYLESERGKRFVEDFWHVYNKELNAEERQDFDPLIHELNYQINNLLR